MAIMLSRVADSLYWMSRYLERTENTARMLSTLFSALADTPLQDTDITWRRLLRALWVLHEAKGPIDSAALAKRLLLDVDEPCSMLHCLSEARENARQIREQISSEMWRRLNSHYLDLSSANFDRIWSDNALGFCARAIDGLHLFSGTAAATFSRGEGWQFMEVGRCLERILFLCRLLETYHGAGGTLPVPRHLGWVNLLKTCSAYEAYCQAHTTDVRPKQVMEFLIFDADFPRSIRYAAGQLHERLARLSPDPDARGGGRAQRLAGRLRASLDYGVPDELTGEGVPAYLSDIDSVCRRIHQALVDCYISYTVDSRIAV